MTSKSENLKREMINQLIDYLDIDWDYLSMVEYKGLYTHESDIVMRKIIAKLKEDV